MKKRIGKFAIQRQVIDSNPDLVRSICKDVAIVSAMYQYPTDAVDYMGVSDHFEEVGNQQPVPIYEIKINSVEGVAQVQFEKVGE